MAVKSNSELYPEAWQFYIEEALEVGLYQGLLLIKS